MCTPNFVHGHACRSRDVTIGCATEPAGHDQDQWQCWIAIFTRCDVYSKFGEFWGMFKPPKLWSKWEKYNKVFDLLGPQLTKIHSENLLNKKTLQKRQTKGYQTKTSFSQSWQKLQHKITILQRKTRASFTLPFAWGILRQFFAPFSVWKFQMRRGEKFAPALICLWR